jgi:ADP-ribosylglycohydrolase
MHDVLDDRDLVPDEAEQLAHSGYDVAPLLDAARRAAAEDDYSKLAAISAELKNLERSDDWPYVEPEDEPTLCALADGLPRLDLGTADLPDRTHAAWLGRCVANTMGKPVEGLPRNQVELYLKAAGEWPQRGYLPLLVELPEGVERLHESAPFSTLGRFDAVPRDDDLDWNILVLSMLETYGRELTVDDISRTWLDRLPFTQTFTAERAVYRNVVRGIEPAAAARVNNPYREWIGALIRGDIFGYVFPGDPGRAASLARVDGSFSHVGNGLYGEIWAAALVSAAFAETAADGALRVALAAVPSTSRLAESQAHLLELHRSGASTADALAYVDDELGHYNWVHTVNNAALITIGLLWGEDFTSSVALPISGGRDTDSSAATVGSVYGALHGSAAIPERLVGSTHVRVRSSVGDFDRISIAELAERTVALQERFA